MNYKEMEEIVVKCISDFKLKEIMLEGLEYNLEDNDYYFKGTSKVKTKNFLEFCEHLKKANEKNKEDIAKLEKHFME